MDSKQVIRKTRKYVEEVLLGESSGHDWWHIVRVCKIAKEIAKKEKANMFVVELAALLHDISDWKFNNGDESEGAKVAEKWLLELGVDKKVIDNVCEIIRTSSFKGDVKEVMKTIEGKVVQDADRIDAIGAIGIARTFATGAKFNEVIYDPKSPPIRYKSSEEYTKSKSKKGRSTINHFYEKLLLLKDLMNTDTAKKIALERHEFVEKYLKQFFKEWEAGF